MLLASSRMDESCVLVRFVVVHRGLLLAVEFGAPCPEVLGQNKGNVKPVSTRRVFLVTNPFLEQLIKQCTRTSFYKTAGRNSQRSIGVASYSPISRPNICSD